MPAFFSASSASNDIPTMTGIIDVHLGKRLMELMERTRCVIRQVNGQRIFGPPLDWQDPVPVKGSEVFVGKLPRDMAEDELVPVFSSVGIIYELRLMMDLSGTNRGYAFVTYANPRTAERAANELDSFEIRPGRNIGVCISVDNCRLFVGGIPKHLDQGDIFRAFAEHTHGVRDVILYCDYEDRTQNRGFAFIEYESHRAAAMARRELIPTTKLNLWNTELKVDWAEPEAVVDERVMQRYVSGSVNTDLRTHTKKIISGVTVLYARNLAAATTEEELSVIFSFSGRFQLTKVKKIRDFAFIHFHVRDEADCALRQLNGIILHNSVVEVCWAKPPECSVRRQSRCNVEGYRSYPRHPQSTNGCQLNGFVTPPLDGPRDVGVASGSTLERTPRNSYKGVKSVFNKYPMIFAAICNEKHWGEPHFQVTAVTSLPNQLVEFKCKLTVPELNISVEETSFGVDDVKSKAAYIMMRQLGIRGSHDTLSAAQSTQNISTRPDSDLDFLQNYLSSVGMNDVGQGDGSNYMPSSSSSGKDATSKGHSLPNSPDFLCNGLNISNFHDNESNTSNSSDFCSDESSTSDDPKYLSNGSSAPNISDFSANEFSMPTSPYFINNLHMTANPPFAEKKVCAPIGSNLAENKFAYFNSSRNLDGLRTRRFLNLNSATPVRNGSSVGNGESTPGDAFDGNGSNIVNGTRFFSFIGDNAANNLPTVVSAGLIGDLSPVTSTDNLARPMSLFQSNSVDVSELFRSVMGKANIENKKF